MPGPAPAAILAAGLTRVYRVPRPPARPRRRPEEPRAPPDPRRGGGEGRLSFRIEPGEIVGFLGPKGAGKTTTLKMLSGLPSPSAGQVRVPGHEPFRRDREYLRQITLVMGNRNQLVWDIPVSDSFERDRAVRRYAAVGS